MSNVAVSIRDWKLAIFFNMNKDHFNKSLLTHARKLLLYLKEMIMITDRLYAQVDTPVWSHPAPPTISCTC